MKIHMLRTVCVCAALSAGLLAPRAWPDDEFHARVSFDAGGTLIKGQDDVEWSHATVNTLVLGGDSLWVDKGGTTELEMAGGSFLRMADSSKAEISALPPSAAVRAYTGSFYVHRLRRSSGQFTLITPAGVVDVANDSSARIDVGHDGSTTVSVHWGRASVRAEGAEGVTATESQRVYLDPGMLPSDPEPFNVSDEDDFDQWNRERTVALVEGFKAVPADVPVQQTTVGVGDLAPYGEWVQVDNRSCWRPTVVTNYVPYRTGHWSYVSRVGYVWVEDYPFSYVTTHYGRWIYRAPYGWVWGYDPVWSPAWCATVHYGDNLVWSPIGFDNLPVVTTTSATFNVGGVLFSVSASSFVPVSAAYYGGTLIRPVTPVVIQNVPPAQINVWNITVNNYNSPVHVPYRGKDIQSRHFSPRIVARGPVTFGRFTEKADDRARALETRSPVSHFTAPEKVRSNAARTLINPPQNRAALRSVRIQPEQRVAHTPQGAEIEARPWARQNRGGQSGGGKLETKPSVTRTPDREKNPPERTEQRGSGRGPAVHEQSTVAPDNRTKAPGKTESFEQIPPDSATDRAAGRQRTTSHNTVTDRRSGPASDSGAGKTEPRSTVGDRRSGPVIDSGARKTEPRGVAGDRRSGPVIDSGAGKTEPRGVAGDRRSGPATDSGARKTEPRSTVIDRRAGPANDSGTAKTNTRVSPPELKVRGPVDRNMNKTPERFGQTTRQPEVNTEKGKSPASYHGPANARGKSTGRDNTLDKNGKKSKGKSDKDNSDDSTDEKKK